MLVIGQDLKKISTFKMNSSICIICARKNSKGIKNKNLLKLKKKTLIEISFEQAKKTKIFDKIILSTDSDSIIKKSKSLSFDLIVKRPSNLASDKASKIDAIKHALSESEKYFNKIYKNVIDLDVTSPLRNIDDIKKSFKKFQIKKANNLITICDSRKNPYFNMIEKKGNSIKLVIDNKLYKSRQIAPKVFEMNASIYIWKRNSLLEKRLFNSKTIFYEMPVYRSIDIDSIFDFKIVKFIYENKKLFK